ncbi:excalibur calcium-binding domain-containing protein [Alkalicoccus daliensis]|uniref:LPXTG-motif cell wall anchor domain-containing protein n=1 Tax=Alkalicoccus daliensis TaxID=745820 RepID=A0A1H0F5Q9_9BACI|nr:excalibur calcium-binding domain-containing protein [Alkalicoccus daliensis]SDN89912.1 LPXTG-motif cell wall anchor domain-containing protein [Alkalicoccus daliensis]
MLRKWIVSVMSVAVVGFGGMTAVHADHEEGTINCEYFEDGEHVWTFWNEHGYSSEYDPEGLDRDNDGWPCEGKTAGMEQQFKDYDAEVLGEQDPDPEPTNNDPDNNGNNETEESGNNNNDNNHNDNNSDNNTADVNNENNANEEAAADADEGNEMPATSTTNPTFVLFGVILAGMGAVMMMRRRSVEA